MKFPIRMKDVFKISPFVFQLSRNHQLLWLLCLSYQVTVSFQWPAPLRHPVPIGTQSRTAKGYRHLGWFLFCCQLFLKTRLKSQRIPYLVLFFVHYAWSVLFINDQFFKPPVIAPFSWPFFFWSPCLLVHFSLASAGSLLAFDTESKFEGACL